MHFQTLQKRAKETKRQEKKTEVKQKDGTVKVIQKYKRKKQRTEKCVGCHQVFVGQRGHLCQGGTET